MALNSWIWGSLVNFIWMTHWKEPGHKSHFPLYSFVVGRKHWCALMRLNLTNLKLTHANLNTNFVLYFVPFGTILVTIYSPVSISLLQEWDSSHSSNHLLNAELRLLASILNYVTLSTLKLSQPCSCKENLNVRSGHFYAGLPWTHWPLRHTDFHFHRE